MMNREEIQAKVAEAEKAIKKERAALTSKFSPSLFKLHELPKQMTQEEINNRVKEIEVSNDFKPHSIGTQVS